jgi:hypothetical protein
MMMLDQYRMQEVAYGHAGFLGRQTWRVLPLAWLEHNLLSPVTSCYATAKVQSIEYQLNGAWVDANTAAQSGAWQQVRITYDNGLVITANNLPEPLPVGDYTLPQYGWLAQGAGVTAYTARRAGKIVDYAETADSLFANARYAPDWDCNLVKPAVADFAQTGDRTFRVTYNWQVNEPVLMDFNAIVHFNHPGEAHTLAFAQDHPPTQPTSAWTAGQTVADGPYTITLPPEVADGDYEWMTGLETAGETPQELPSIGQGNGRFQLGTLSVRDGGKTLTFTPEPDKPVGERFLRHLNVDDAPVDFGAVRTNGSLQIRRDGPDWVLQTLPRNRAFTVDLSVKRFPPPAQVLSPGGSAATAAVTPGPLWWTLTLNGAREYRWPATAPPPP